MTDLDNAAAAAPAFAQTYYNRGIAFARAGDMRRAIGDFTHAIALAPDYTEAFNNRGFALETLGERELAEADFITAYVLQPGNARFRRKLIDRAARRTAIAARTIARTSGPPPLSRCGPATDRRCRCAGWMRCAPHS